MITNYEDFKNTSLYEIHYFYKPDKDGIIMETNNYLAGHKKKKQKTKKTLCVTLLHLSNCSKASKGNVWNKVRNA